MKKAKFVLLLLVVIVLLCNTVEGASSAKDIEIIEVKILEQNREAHIIVKYLPRPIGFNVFLNNIEITEYCSIRFGINV